MDWSDTKADQEAKTMAKNPAQEELLAVTRKSQEAVIAAIRTWAETVRAVSPKLAPLSDNLPKLPSAGAPFGDQRRGPQDAMASAYDVAEQLLASQRKFVEDLLKAIARLTPGLADPAGQVTRPPSQNVPQAKAAASEPKGGRRDVQAGVATPKTYKPGQIVPRDGTVECSRHPDIKDHVKARTRFAPCAHHHEHSVGCTWRYLE